MSFAPDGGAGDEDAGDARRAGVDVLLRLVDVVELVERELLVGEERLRVEVRPHADREDDEVVLRLRDVAAVLDVLVAQDEVASSASAIEATRPFTNWPPIAFACSKNSS